MNEKTCSILDCGKPHVARDWCQKHYQRWLTHGDPHIIVAHTIGEACGNAKLTEKDVIAIRADPRFIQEIAKDYGIDQSNVSLIKNRKRWAHVK